MDGIFNATISANLSMPFKSTTQAKEEIKSEFTDLTIEVFDSKTKVGAMGFIVLAAASAKDLKSVVKVAKAIRTKIN